MKILNYIPILILVFCSCTKEDSSSFDLPTSVHFGVPAPGALNSTTTDFGYNTFKYVSPTASTDVYIPVRTLGLPFTTDKELNVRINSDSSKYNPDNVSIFKSTFRADSVSDRIVIRFKPDAGLKLRNDTIRLELLPSDGVEVNKGYFSYLKVAYNSVLPQPSWWIDLFWGDYFGPYYPEVYDKWMQIYYKGADPTPGPNGEADYYYYANMPVASFISPTQAIFVYIRQLKEYFDNNVVYPNNDSSKPRIILPNR